MLRKSIITTVVLSCITISSYTIDINIPGADQSIPNNAYENSIYMTPTMEESIHRSVDKAVETLTTKAAIKDMTGVDSVSNEALEAFKIKSYALVRQQFDASTVINIHNEEGGLSFTVPVTALRSEKEDVDPRFNVSYLITAPMVSIGVIENTTPRERTKGEVDIAYGTLRDSYFRKTKVTDSLGKQELNSLHVKTEHSNSPEYTIVLFSNDRNVATFKDIDSMTVNYVLPSIHSLQYLDSYSRYESLVNYTFRVPKNAATVMNPPGITNRATFIVGTDTIEQVHTRLYKTEMAGVFQTQPMINVVLDTKYDDEIHMFGLPSGVKPVKAQHTYVWNDGVPGFLLDVELNNNRGILAFTTRDSNTEYTHSIEYPLTGGEYTKAQLKYMIVDAQIANTGHTFEGQQMFI